MDSERVKAVFGHRMRAGVTAYLLDCGLADFMEIAGVMNVPNNLLSSHLRTLEHAGIIVLDRGFLGRKPRTQIRLTQAGRRAWLTWLDLVAQNQGVDES